MKTLAIDLDYQATLRNRCVAPREIELYLGRSPGQPHGLFMGKYAKRTSHLLLDEGCVNSAGDEFIAELAVPMNGVDEEFGRVIIADEELDLADARMAGETPAHGRVPRGADRHRAQRDLPPRPRPGLPDGQGEKVAAELEPPGGWYDTNRERDPSARDRGELEDRLRHAGPSRAARRRRSPGTSRNTSKRSRGRTSCPPTDRHAEPGRVAGPDRLPGEERR